MPPIGREEFGEALAGLDPESLARFVAEVHRARGATVERSGRRLRVTDGEWTREFVVVDADEDAAVDVEGRSGPADAVDVGALHRLILYGVDRATCAALVERHLGRPLDSFVGDVARPPSVDPAPRTSERTTGYRAAGRRGTDARSRVDEPGNDDSTPADGGGGRSATGGLDRAIRRPFERRLAVAAVLAVVLAAGLVGVLVVGVPGTGGNETPGLPERMPSQPLEPDPTETGADDAIERATLVDGTLENGLEPAAPDPRPEVLPPGVNASGAIDEVTLAERTVAHLSNRSYRLTLVVRESVDGRPNAFRRETVRVENATAHVASVTRAGRFVTVPPELAPEESYSNIRVRAGPSDPVPDVPYARAIDRYLRWYLSVSRSSIADVRAGDGTGGVWLVLDGDPHPGVVNTTGSALVDGRGVVREIHRTYEAPDQRGVTVTVMLRIEMAESTELPPGVRTERGRVLWRRSADPSRRG